MEEWKWDAWEAERNQKALESAIATKAASVTEGIEQVNSAPGWSITSESNKWSESNQDVSTTSVSSAKGGEASQAELDPERALPPNATSSELISMPSEPLSQPDPANASITVYTKSSPSISEGAGTLILPPTVSSAQTAGPSDDSSQSTEINVKLDVQSIKSKEAMTSSPQPSSTQSLSESLPSTTLSSSLPTTKQSSASSVPSPSYSPYLIASHQVTSLPSGESVFRTIANRISALEYNHTLYMQYVEVQNRNIRETIKKLEEDVGRLTGIVRGTRFFFVRCCTQLPLE